MNRLKSDNNDSESINKNEPHSPPLLTEIIEDDRDSRIFKTFKSRLPLIAGVTLGITAIFGFSSLFQQPQYRGKFKLLIERKIDSKYLINLENNEADKIQATENQFAREIAILRSSRVIEPVIENLAAKYPDLNYQQLIAAEHNSPLQIKHIKNTGILEVSYEDRNLEKIQDVLAGLSEGYYNYSLKTEQKEFDRGIKLIEERLETIEKRLENLQVKKQIFAEKYSQIDPKKQAEILTNKLIELETEYFNTKVKLNEQKSLHQILQGQLGHDTSTAIAIGYLSESDRYQELLDRLQEIEIQIAKGASIWKENSPMLASLKDKKAKLLPLLRQQARASLGNNISINFNDPTALTSSSALRLKLNQQFILAANEVEILNFRSKALSEAIKALNQKISTMPQIVREFDAIEQELDGAKAIKQRLLLAKEELHLEAAKQTSVWQPLSSPTIPSKPIAPNSSRNVSLGLLSGLLLGLGVAVFTDRSLSKSDRDRLF